MNVGLLICILFASSAVNGLPKSSVRIGSEEFEDIILSEITQDGHKASVASRRRGCTFRISDGLAYPQPVYIHGDTYLTPSGNSGNIVLEANEEMLLACVGPNRNIIHPNVIARVNQAKVRCVGDSSVSGDGWLNGNVPLGELNCSSHPQYTAEETGETCFGGNKVIRVGYIVDQIFHPLFWSCFDQNRLEVLYVWYPQTSINAVFQTGIDRPYWSAGNFFGDIDVNNLYTQVQQRVTIAGLIGQELTDKYITQKQFLSRGHLAARTDFVFATGQRASFFFINAAPQWQPFNAGNWNSLEQNLRLRVAERGYNTIIYTGTFGIMQLRNERNDLVDIYLHSDVNNNPQLPVPLYFYKVVYEESSKRGTAFVSINNPYLTLEEAIALQFCPDQCRDEKGFDWIRWNPDQVDIGYSFCCNIDDFRLTVPYLPDFPVEELLGNSGFSLLLSKLLVFITFVVGCKNAIWI